MTICNNVGSEDKPVVGGLMLFCVTLTFNLEFV